MHKEFAKNGLKKNMPVPQAPEGEMPNREPDADQVLEELAQEFIELYRAGKIPEDLDIEAICQDGDFIELTREFPLEAALRIYIAEQRCQEAEAGAKRNLEEQVKRRGTLPKSQRSNLAVNPSPDYRNMTSEEFRKLEQQYKRMAMAGKKVNL